MPTSVSAVCRSVVLFSLFVQVTVAALAATAEPPVQLPDTPAGRRMSAYLEAWNAHDPAKLEAFVRSAFSPAALAERPVEARLAFHAQVRGEHGGFAVQKIIDSQPGTLMLQVRGTTSGTLLRLGIEVEPKEPHHVLGFRIQLGGGEGEPAPAPASAETPLSLDGAKAAIDAEISAAAKDDRFAGVVAIRRGETAWYERAVGAANRETQIPNRMETRFNLGSIQKFFTQTVIARLCQEGKLRLDDKLIEVLPSYPNPAVARRVTIGQLVEHTAGFGDFFGAAFRAEPRKVRTLTDYLSLFVDQPLMFEPGARFEYSNAGFIVLGLVIEAKTGLPYDEAVRRFVFEPAGMKSTSLDPVENEAPDRAVGYRKPQGPGGVWTPNRGGLPGKGSSAGGGYSTAADLIRFVDALRADRLVDFGWTEWLLGAPALADGSKPASGARHQRSLGVAGGSEGVNAVLFFDLADGSVTAVLANLDEPAAERLFERIRGLLGRVRGR